MSKACNKKMKGEICSLARSSNAKQRLTIFTRATPRALAALLDSDVNLFASVFFSVFAGFDVEAFDGSCESRPVESLGLSVTHLSIESIIFGSIGS